MTIRDPNHKGNIAEMEIAAAATQLGIDVSKPLAEHTRYDLIFDLGSRLLRVQCKWAPLKGRVIPLNLMSSRCTSGGDQIRVPYGPEEIDAVAAYCPDLDRCYLIPVKVIAGMRAISLRLAETKNGQKASLNWGSEYELEGAVAQLEVALPWHGRGRRFESDQLHSSVATDVELVGAHQFRNHFGWYMERALAGDRFVVTKRGKPDVRLIPAAGQLALPSAEPAAPLADDDRSDAHRRPHGPAREP